MTELTQFERAQCLAESFIPTEPSEGCYVYVFLGEASWDASVYEVVDGQYLMCRRVWHIDETQTDCVCYAGRGQNGRIDELKGHPARPSPELRIKLRSDLSYSDSLELERQLIYELGCICDDYRSDGCLVNIKYYENGPYCCPALEAAAYKSASQGRKCAADVIVMTEDKTIVTRGSLRGLARELGFHRQRIADCCKNKARGIWQSSKKRALYFCYADQYESYLINPMTNQQYSLERILIVAKLDGLDVFCGTATEIAKYVTDIKGSGHLHSVARGEASHAYGFTARYVDELADEIEAPVATCGPNICGTF